MKKSIALFVTITFLIIITAIIGTILSYTQKMTKSNNFYIAENSILIKKTLSTLKNITKDINSSQTLKSIFTTFPISNKNGNFRIIYSISPVYNKIDINAYLKNGKINLNIDSYLDNILEYYRLQDPLFFKNLLLDTLDRDTKEREGYSEIILQNPFFQNGKIYNFRQFKQIEKQYYKITEDKNIFKIPWKKLIFFGNGKKHIIDCSLLNKQTAMFMGLQFKGNPTCKNILTQNNRQITNNFDIIKFKNKHSFLIKIKINYFYGDINSSINIVYDIHKKKAVLIESHPVY